MKARKRKFHFLDLLKRISRKLDNIVAKSITKYEIAYADKLAKHFHCKYVYTVYYEEGFDSLISIEEVPGIMERCQLKMCREEDDRNITVIPCSRKDLFYDANRFYTSLSHVVATNITAEEAKEEKQ